MSPILLRIGCSHKSWYMRHTTYGYSHDYIDDSDDYKWLQMMRHFMQKRNFWRQIYNKPVTKLTSSQHLTTPCCQKTTGWKHGFVKRWHADDTKSSKDDMLMTDLHQNWRSIDDSQTIPYKIVVLTKKKEAWNKQREWMFLKNTFNVQVPMLDLLVLIQMQNQNLQ